MNASPLLSVVIANYNYGRYLEEAIRSVLCQSCKDFELIICDGGSTDDSLEIIRQHGNSIAWWCSEPDGGQSAAFNKGFAHASGQFLTWLNADDVMLPDAVKLLQSQVSRYPECQWFGGGAVYFSGSSKAAVARSVIPNSFVQQLLRVPSWLRVDAPSTFFSRDLFHRSKQFDLSLKYVMDIELWMQFCDLGVNMRHLPSYTWGFRLHEQSKTASALTEKIRDERFEVERRLIRCQHGVSSRTEHLAIFRKRLGCLADFSYVRRFFCEGTNVMGEVNK